jgi:hypothetical protein
MRPKTAALTAAGIFTAIVLVCTVAALVVGLQGGDKSPPEDADKPPPVHSLLTPTQVVRFSQEYDGNLLRVQGKITHTQVVQLTLLLYLETEDPAAECIASFEDSQVDKAFQFLMKQEPFPVVTVLGKCQRVKERCVLLRDCTFVTK